MDSKAIIAATGQKVTLWGFITAMAGYLAWLFIWFWLFWLGSLKGLNNLGFDRVPDATWYGLVIVDTLVTIIVSIWISGWFTEFKEWAKQKEL